jgi:hypothetical protein
MNSNWVRWITASCIKHFDDGKGSYSVFAEGDERQTDQLQNWAEVRIGGPNVEEVSKDYFRIDVEINILLTTVIDQTDAYAHQRLVGHFHSLFSCINVFRYGDGNNYLGTLQLSPSPVVIVTYGVMQFPTRVLQSTINGRFSMHLSGET